MARNQKAIVQQAEWKRAAISPRAGRMQYIAVSPRPFSAMRFLQFAIRGRRSSAPVMNRILIAAKRSRIAVIRFGPLSIYNRHVVVAFPDQTVAAVLRGPAGIACTR